MVAFVVEFGEETEQEDNKNTALVGNRHFKYEHIKI